jgi:hypothetical protein
MSSSVFRICQLARSGLCWKYNRRRVGGSPARSDEEILIGVGKSGHGHDRFLFKIDGRMSIQATVGKSISVSLMRLKTLVKTVVAKARLTSISCASV